MDLEAFSNLKFKKAQLEKKRAGIVEKITEYNVNYGSYNQKITKIMNLKDKAKAANRTIEEYEKMQAEIQAENAISGDLIQGDFTDNYRNLSIKHLLALHYVKDHCKNFRYKTGKTRDCNSFEEKRISITHSHTYVAKKLFLGSFSSIVLQLPLH